jgi:hypothetical protein
MIIRLLCILLIEMPVLNLSSSGGGGHDNEIVGNDSHHSRNNHFKVNMHIFSFNI